MVNHNLLKTKQFILLLNKKDLYEKKIKTRDIIDHFPAYKGRPGDAIQGIKYFDSKFRDPNVVTRNIPMHLTCCVDTNSMTAILSELMESLSRNLLAETEFLC